MIMLGIKRKKKKKTLPDDNAWYKKGKTRRMAK